MKAVILARAGSADRQAFGRWLTTEFERRLPASVNRANALIINPEESAPPYDAIVQLWSDVKLDNDAIAAIGLTSHATLDVRASDEVIGKKATTPPAIGQTPGIAQLTLIATLPGMPRAEAMRHWSEHIPLAVDIHVGMNRYVQDRLWPGADGSPPWIGLAHLHFPDADALKNGLFRSHDDIKVISDDVAEFVTDYATMLGTEYVLRA